MAVTLDTVRIREHAPGVLAKLRAINQLNERVQKLKKAKQDLIELNQLSKNHFNISALPSLKYKRLLKLAYSLADSKQLNFLEKVPKKPCLSQQGARTKLWLQKSLREQIEPIN